MKDFFTQAVSLYRSDPWWMKILLLVPWIVVLIMGVIMWWVWSSTEKVGGVVSRRKEAHEKKMGNIQEEKERLKEDVQSIEEELQFIKAEAENKRRGIDAAVNDGSWSYMDHYINRVLSRTSTTRRKPNAKRDRISDTDD